MRTQSTSKESHADTTRPFFSVQRPLAPSFFSQSPFAIATQAEPEAAEELETERPEAVVQPKLTMDVAGDRFGREADVVADSVVQRLESGEDRNEAQNKDLPSVQMKCAACREDEMLQRGGGSMRTRTGRAYAVQPFFGARPSARPFFAPMVQAKCAACAEEDQLQRSFLQAKLSIGAPGDRFE